MSGETKSWRIHCGQKEGLGEGLSLLSQLLWLEASGKVWGHLIQVPFRGRKDTKGVVVCTPIGWGPRPTC